jgi:hypothetical protein
MDPLTLAMLGSTAISGIGALMGANASTNANQENARISAMNAQQRERERAQALQLAMQSRADAQLGMTDASGSRIHFDPQRGWVTDLGAIDQELQGRNIRAGGLADAYMRELQNLQPMSGERMSGLLYDKATRGVNDAFQGQLSTGLRTATRQGNPRLAAALMGQSSKAQGQAQHDAAVDAELQGRQYADQFNQSQRSGLANLIGAFSGQAAKPVGPSNYIPQFAGQAGGANNALIQTAGSQGGTLQPQQANTGFGSALASIGQLGYGAAQSYQANQRSQDAMDILRRKYA